MIKATRGRTQLSGRGPDAVQSMHIRDSGRSARSRALLQSPFVRRYGRSAEHKTDSSPGSTRRKHATELTRRHRLVIARPVGTAAEDRGCRSGAVRHRQLHAQTRRLEHRATRPLRSRGRVVLRTPPIRARYDRPRVPSRGGRALVWPSRQARDKLLMITTYGFAAGPMPAPRAEPGTIVAGRDAMSDHARV